MDEEADPDQVIAAIQMILKYKKDEKNENGNDIKDVEDVEDDGDELDLEWKLEKINKLTFNKTF